MSIPATAKRISSKTTLLQKRVMPPILFGTLLVATFIGLSATRHSPALLPLALLPLLIGVLLYLLLRKLVFDMADEVWDAGDSLIVKNDGETERIAFANIMNVSYTVIMNPPRVTLRLRLPCRFGHEVSFLPVLRFLPLATHPVIDDLIVRIDQARRGIQ